MENELVSIIMRTYNKKDVLRQTLQCIRNQTYPNIEVVIVEDGENTAQQMLQSEFGDLNIKYACNGECKGRTYTGNRALGMASGEYFNFLDDDDWLYPTHVEHLVKQFSENAVKAVYSIAYESVCDFNTQKGEYKERKRFVRYAQPYNKVYLAMANYIPIQSIMFHRSLYDELGGFDEKLDLLEDWDLWLRYSTKTDFIFLNEITSFYRVPRNNRQRNIELHEQYESVREKFKDYCIEMNLYDLNRDLVEIFTEIRRPKWKRKLVEIKDKIYFRR